MKLSRISYSTLSAAEFIVINMGVSHLDDLHWRELIGMQYAYLSTARHDTGAYIMTSSGNPWLMYTSQSASQRPALSK